VGETGIGNLGVRYDLLGEKTREDRG